MLYDFLKNPSIQFKQNKSFSDSPKDLFSVLLNAFLFLFINYLIVSFVDFVIKSTTKFSFFEAIESSQTNASYTKSVWFFLILAPVFEELIFRLPLKLTRLNLLISMILSYFMFYLLRKPTIQVTSVQEIAKHIVYGLMCSFLVFSFKESSFSAISDKYFNFFFYVLTVIFGILHISNFIDLVPSNLIVLAPIFTFHQIIVGFFLGYLRLKRGIMWCILLHFLLNLLPTLSYFLSK